MIIFGAKWTSISCYRCPDVLEFLPYSGHPAISRAIPCFAIVASFYENDGGWSLKHSRPRAKIARVHIINIIRVKAIAAGRSFITTRCSTIHTGYGRVDWRTACNEVGRCCGILYEDHQHNHLGMKNMLPGEIVHPYLTDTLRDNVFVSIFWDVEIDRLRSDNGNEGAE
jgi:hypothetical protein